MEQKKKYQTVRFEVIPGLYDKLEKIRLSSPIGDRLNKSAFIRKILHEYVQKHSK